jgi:hypothetical protein
MQKRNVDTIQASNLASNFHEIPVAKRARINDKGKNNSRNKQRGGRMGRSASPISSSASDSDSSVGESGVNTRSRNPAPLPAKTAAAAESPSESGSEYEASEDDDGEDEEQQKMQSSRRGKRDMDPALIRRSSRTAVLNAVPKTPVHISRSIPLTGTAPRTTLLRSLSEGSGVNGFLGPSSSGIAPFLSSASMRRSRRSRNVDVTKELVVMFPDDDPRTMQQLDLRGKACTIGSVYVSAIWLTCAAMICL